MTISCDTTANIESVTSTDGNQQLNSRQPMYIEDSRNLFDLFDLVKISDFEDICRDTNAIHQPQTNNTAKESKFEPLKSRGTVTVSSSCPLIQCEAPSIDPAILKTKGSYKERRSSSKSTPINSSATIPIATTSTRELTSCQFAFPLTRNPQIGFIKKYLYNGSSFSGKQKSATESYDVNVNIKFVDYENSYLCGYLCINFLTKEHPTLTTFFDGEIISKRRPFLTSKWEADECADLAHWSKFDEFKEKYEKGFINGNLNYDLLNDADYIYMRWKEQFLVPDHRVKNVEGASYAGFYYICYSKKTSSIRGYYYHVAEHFESFQALNLELDHTMSSQVYEFR